MSPLTRRQFLGAAAGLVAVGPGLALPAQGLTINPRSSWGSDLAPKGPLAAEDVRFLIVHHSASNNGHGPGDVPSILRSWYDLHTGPRGWNDVAYNFVIDSAGGIWEGRQGSIDGPVAGDASGGNQGFTQLACVIGDTNTAQPSAAARASLVQLLAWLSERYGVSTAPGAEVTFTSRGSNRWPAGQTVTTATIAGHRDMSQTSCPGESLYAYVVGSLRADVEAARGGSAPAQPPATTSTSAAPATTTTTATPATTTTTVSTTTTIAASTTTIPPATTTVPPSTIPSSTTTSSVPSALAEAAGAGQTALPAGLVVTASTLLATGAGLLLWRQRRMGDKP